MGGKEDINIPSSARPSNGKKRTRQEITIDDEEVKNQQQPRRSSTAIHQQASP